MMNNSSGSNNHLRSLDHYRSMIIQNNRSTVRDDVYFLITDSGGNFFCPRYIIRIGTLPQSWILLAEEVSQPVIGGHWRSLIRLIWLIRLIRSTRLDLQWRCRLHNYMWMGWDWMGWDGMVIIGRRQSKSPFGANK